MADVAQCANSACRQLVEWRPTGRPATYCGSNCRQAAHRERARVAEAERQRAVQPSADPGSRDGYSAAAQAAVLQACDHVASQAVSIPCQGTDASGTAVTKQEAGESASMTVTRDEGDAQEAPSGSGVRPPAWPPWAWTVA